LQRDPRYRGFFRDTDVLGEMVKIPTSWWASEMAMKDGQLAFGPEELPTMPVVPDNLCGLVYTSGHGPTKLWADISRQLALPLEACVELHPQLKILRIAAPAEKYGARIPGVVDSDKTCAMAGGALSRFADMSNHMKEQAFAQTFAGAIPGMNSDMSDITAAPSSIAINKQCAASQLRAGETVLARVERSEQRDSWTGTVRKELTYGDSASVLPDIGRTFEPEIRRLFPTRWEEADMGALQDKAGKIFSNENGHKQVVRKKKTRRNSTEEWQITLVPMELVPDTEHM